MDAEKAAFCFTTKIIKGRKGLNLLSGIETILPSSDVAQVELLDQELI